MAKPVPAVDYLTRPDDYPPQPVCALIGPERFLVREALVRLRSAVLGEHDAEFAQTVFDGRETHWNDVLDTLATRAMFGPGKRLVVIEHADKSNETGSSSKPRSFIEKHRQALEAYVEQPIPAGVLVLQAQSLPANTRLHKAIVASGLLIDCKPPPLRQLGPWLVQWARHAHGVALGVPAANLLVEMVGTDLGSLDQEVARLALLAGGRRARISIDLVRKAAGSWRTRSTWDMLDAALLGNLGTAMGQFDRLIQSGENPIGLLAQISASVRRLAAATRIVLDAERHGRRVSLRDALAQSGVPGFALTKTERQLRRLGRERGRELSRWLLETELGLKGDSPLKPRFLIERLLILLGGPRQQIAPSVHIQLVPRHY